MRRFLGITGTLLVILMGTVYAVSEARLRDRFPVPREIVRAATDPVSVVRGRHLATAVAGCAGCHGSDLGGRDFIDAKPFGRWYAPNLTMGRGGAASRMSDGELEAAIRHGVRPDGHSVHIMPSEAYAALGDDDLASLLGYIRSLPPVDRELPPPVVGPIARVLLVMGRLPLQTAAQVAPDASHPPRGPARGPTAAYGQYLAEVGGCKTCHGPGLSGGPNPAGPPGGRPAANLTPAGIGHYTEADFFRALRQGVRPGGVPIDPEQMPWETMRHMTDEELRALWSYLRSVSAKPFGGR